MIQNILNKFRNNKVSNTVIEDKKVEDKQVNTYSKIYCKDGCLCGIQNKEPLTHKVIPNDLNWHHNKSNGIYYAKSCHDKVIYVIFSYNNYKHVVYSYLIDIGSIEFTHFQCYGTYESLENAKNVVKDEYEYSVNLIYNRIMSHVKEINKDHINETI